MPLLAAAVLTAVAGVLACVPPAATAAEPEPAASTSAAPLTGEAAATTRPRLVPPPGFHLVHIGERRFLIEPADEPWVRRAVATAPPATRPSTLPADLLANIESRGGRMVDSLAADLAVPPERVSRFLHETLIPELRLLNDSPIASVAMVATRSQYRRALESGWDVPSIRYNRSSGEVLFVQTMIATSDADSVDAVVPFLVLEEHTEDEKVDKLARELANLDESALRAHAQRGQFILQAVLLRFIGGDVLGELKLPREAEWVSIGITGCLTAKYTSLLSGVSRRSIIEAMTAEPRRAPPGYVRATSIDLVQPLDVTALRPNAVVPYLDAVRRKAVAAIDHLLFQHGDEVLPRIITSFRERPPTDSADAIRRIADLTGTDLTERLRAVR